MAAIPDSTTTVPPSVTDSPETSPPQAETAAPVLSEQLTDETTASSAAKPNKDLTDSAKDSILLASQQSPDLEESADSSRLLESHGATASSRALQQGLPQDEVRLLKPTNRTGNSRPRIPVPKPRVPQARSPMLQPRASASPKKARDAPSGPPSSAGQSPRENLDELRVSAASSAVFRNLQGATSDAGELPEQELTLVALVRKLELELQQKAEEIAALRDVVASANTIKEQSLQAQKIKELVKKSRGLSMALEREKQRSTELSSELDKLRATDALSSASLDPASAEAKCREVVDKAVKEADVARRQAASWREKHDQALTRASQLEAKAGILQGERDKALRALQREIGDSASLAAVLEDSKPRPWLGRAQQIAILQAKLREAKLQNTTAADAEAGETTTKSTTADDPFDAQHRRQLNALSGSRQREAEQLRETLADSERETAAARAAAEKFRARAQCLQLEVKKVKAELASVLEKTHGDTALIEDLNAEVTRLQAELQKAAERASALAASQPKLVKKVHQTAGSPPAQELPLTVASGGEGVASGPEVGPMIGHLAVASGGGGVATGAPNGRAWEGQAAGGGGRSSGIAAEIALLRAQCDVQETQIVRQEQIIVALQRKLDWLGDMQTRNNQGMV